MHKMCFLLIGLFIFTQAQGQVKLTENEAVDLALKNHPSIGAAVFTAEAHRNLANIKRAPEVTQIYHTVTADPDLGIFGTSTFGLQQNFPAPQATRARKTYLEAQYLSADAALKLTKQETILQVKEIYHHLSYLQSKSVFLSKLDSLWQRTLAGSAIRKSAGEISQMEYLGMKDRAGQMRLEAQTIHHEIEFDRLVLGKLIGVPEGVEPIVEQLTEQDYSLSDTAKMIQSARMQYSAAQIAIARAQQKQVAASGALAPVLGAYGQILGNGAIYPGWYLGVQAPLNRKKLHQQVQAASLATQASEAQYAATLLEQQNEMSHLLHELEKYQISIAYYRNQGSALAEELLRSGELNYRSGEMDFSDFIQLTSQASQIELRHLEDLYGLSQTMIALAALLGE